MASWAWPTALTSSRVLRIEREVAVRPDHPVETGTGRRLFGEELAERGPCVPHLAQGDSRMRERRSRSPQRLEVAGKVVGQQLFGRGQESGIPGWCRPNRFIWSCVEERRDRDHRRHAVGDGVVDPHEHADALVGQSGQKRDVPQGAGRVERHPPQLLDGFEKLGFSSRRRYRAFTEVLVDIEALIVHPQRAAQPPPWHMDDLSEPWDEM